MKNLFTKMMLVAVAAMTFIGCSQEPAEINATVKKTTIDLLVNIDDVTRSSFGDKAGDGSYPSVWNAYDSVQVYAVDTNGTVVAKGYGNVEIPEGGDGSTATVRATFNGVETFADLNVAKLYAYVGGWDFYASETALPELSIEAEQTPASASVESSVHTLKAETEWDGSTGQVDLTFSHAAAYGRMVLPQFENTDVKSVEITLNGTTTTLDTRNLETNVYWFATEAIDEVTTFSVKAVSGLFTYSKEINMTGKTLKFITGQVSEFSVKDLVKEELIADAEVTFTDMDYDSANDLWKFTNADGDYVYIPFVTETKGELVSGTYTAAFDMNTVGTYNANNTVVKYGTKPATYPGFNYGDITVTVDGVNVNVDILFEIYDGTDTTDYKTLFHGVYSIVAPTGEFATELATVKSEYYNSPSTSRSLWITTEATPAGVFSIFLTLSVGEDGEAFAVIPEGTYTFGADSGFAIASDAHANIETAEDYVNISEGTLTVSHVGEEYKLVLDITNTEDAHITATWQGVITVQWTWSKDIPHPGYVTALATPENIQYTFNEETKLVTISWNEVANAESYLIDNNGVEETVNTNSYSFTGEYNTSYEISIVAVPATGSTLYKNSDAGSVSFTTPKETSAGADYNVTLTKITNISGNTISFTGDNSQDRMKLEFNPGLASIEAGNYAVVSSFSSSTAMEVSWNSQFNMAEAYNTSYDYYMNEGDLVTVTKSGDDYTITVVALSTYISGVKKSVQLTYTGKLEAEAGLVFTTAEATASQVGGNWVAVTFSDGGSNTLVIEFGVAGNTYLQTGTWNTDYFYSSGYAMNPWVFNGDDVNVKKGTAEVSVADGMYNITFISNDATINASFKGTITNFDLP